jgi:hypothetical protein
LIGLSISWPKPACLVLQRRLRKPAEQRLPRPHPRPPQNSSRSAYILEPRIARTATNKTNYENSRWTLFMQQIVKQVNAKFKLVARIEGALALDFRNLICVICAIRG